MGRVYCSWVDRVSSEKIETSPIFPRRDVRENRNVPNFLAGFILLSGIHLAGCATPYQTQGFQGGFTDARIEGTHDEFEVEFEGNVGLDAKALDDSLLRRAAELSIRNGFTHFEVVGRSRQTGLGFVVQPGILGPSRKTSRSIHVKCYPDNPGGAAISASAFLNRQQPAPSQSSSRPTAL